MGLVFEIPMPPPAKILLLALGDHAADDGTNVRPAVKRMSQKASISERTVQRLLQAFQRPREDAEGRAILVRVKRATNKLPAEYRIDVKALRILGRHADTSSASDRDALGRHADTPSGAVRGDTGDTPRGDTGVTSETAVGVTPEVAGGDSGGNLGVTSSDTQSVSRSNRQEPSVLHERPRAPVHVAIDRFADRWTEQHGKPTGAPADARPLRPHFTDRDAGSLKRLIDAYDLPTVLRAIDAYFDSPDPYYRELGHTLNVFASSSTFTRLIAHGRAAAPATVDLDAPIAWGQPGGLIRKWNEHSPDECRAITNEALSVEWLEAEREQLAKHPDETFWDNVLAQFHQSAYLRGKTRPTPQNPTPLAKTLDWLFSVGRGGIDNAALVHDGKYRDGVAA